MERMLAAMEPVGRDEAFNAVFRDEEVTLREILEYLQQTTRKELHEHCNQAR